MKNLILITLLAFTFPVFSQSKTENTMEKNAKNIKTDDQWKTDLTEEQYRILRECGTEPPFTGKYYKNKEDGKYYCSACGALLFESTTKYDSGSGWPSFYAPAKNENIKEVRDTTHGMERIEIKCAKCDGHLGHVFPDGPKPTGLRYCINSVSLDFKKE
jgi:peptide-methionine (R)-S-oxide reductase